MHPTFCIELVHPGPRPPYYALAEHLWGPDCNIDSDGDSSAPGDTNWTELTITLRESSEASVSIDPVLREPLILAVWSEQIDLCAKAAIFLATSTGGMLRRGAAPLFRVEHVLPRTVPVAVVTTALTKENVNLSPDSTLGGIPVHPHLTNSPRTWNRDEGLTTFLLRRSSDAGAFQPGSYVVLLP